MEPEAWACCLQGERVALGVEQVLLNVLPQGMQRAPSRRRICQDGMLATNLLKLR